MATIINAFGHEIAFKRGKRKKENGEKTYKEKPHYVYCILLILHCPYLFFFCCLFIDVAIFFSFKICYQLWWYIFMQILVSSDHFSCHFFLIFFLNFMFSIKLLLKKQTTFFWHPACRLNSRPVSMETLWKRHANYTAVLKCPINYERYR